MGGGRELRPVGRVTEDRYSGAKGALIEWRPSNRVGREGAARFTVRLKQSSGAKRVRKRERERERERERVCVCVD